MFYNMLSSYKQDLLAQLNMSRKFSRYKKSIRPLKLFFLWLILKSELFQPFAIIWRMQQRPTSIAV